MDFLDFSMEIFENLNIFSKEKLEELCEEMEIYKAGFDITCNKINEVLKEVFLQNVTGVSRYEKIFLNASQSHNDLLKRKENICIFLGLNNNMFSKKYIKSQLLAAGINCDININEDTTEITLENIYYKDEKTELCYVKNIIEKILPLDLIIKENVSGLSWREWEEKDLDFFEFDSLNLKWIEL